MGHRNDTNKNTDKVDNISLLYKRKIEMKKYIESHVQKAILYIAEMMSH